MSDWIEPNSKEFPEWPLYQFSTPFDPAIQEETLLIATRLGGRVLYINQAFRGKGIDRMRADAYRHLILTVHEFEAAGYGPDVFSEEDMK